MILERQKEALILESGTVPSDSIEMSLDLESAQFLMQMLSKNIYSDSIGSTVRETVSNSLDSMRCSGIDKPIVVTFKPNSDGNYEFSTEDFGIGLDDVDVREILSKYGNSTKREDSNSLGMWGLGAKSPLAYASSFYMVCRKNNVERKYMMYEGEDGNLIDLLYESPTESPNGVKVIVPVKYGDRNEFYSKIKEQLAYFEHVYFDISNIDNDFIIHRSEDFQYSELVSTSNLHICLDNVYYLIDFNALGISPINVPVGLRFSLTDGIFPTINRENIRYTQEAKSIISNKIKKVADYFVEKFNQSIINVDNIYDIFNYYDNFSRTVTIENKSFDIKSLAKYSSIPLAIPKLNGIELLDLEDLTGIKGSLVREYKTIFKYERGRLKELKKDYQREFDISDLERKNNKFYLFSEKLSGLKKEYLKSLFGYGTYFIIRKGKNYPLHKSTPWDTDKKNYFNILSLSKHPKSEWRQRIKEFQYIQSLILKDCIDVDKLEISQDWLDSKKRERAYTNSGGGRRIKLEGEVFGKQAVPLERYVNGKNCKFTPVTYKLQNIHKSSYLTVYSSHTNADKLDKLYEISRSCSRVRCVTFSEREMNILKKIEIHNLIPFNKFMEGNNKTFKRLVTAYLISQLIKKYSSVFSKKYRLNSISKDLVSKLTKLTEYREANFNHADEEIYEEMVKVAEQYSLFDTNIYSIYVDIKSFLEKLTFLEPILKTINSYDDESPMIPILVDLFKYYRHRIDYKNYHLNVNNLLDLDELLLTEEELEEEFENELVNN